MTMNRLHTICLLLAAVLIVAMFWWVSDPRRHEINTPAEKTLLHGENPPQHEAFSQDQILKPDNVPMADLAPSVPLQKTDYVQDPARVARAHENLPFEFRGGGTSGRVVDHDGNVLMESGKEIRIYGVSVSPDRRRVLVEGGNAINFILNPETQGKIQLPIRPPGTNMLAFGSWYWVSDHMLVGESGVQKLGDDGLPVKSDDNVAQSKIYVFDITTKKLAEVTLPSGVLTQVFGVVEVSPEGYVLLVDEATGDDRPRQSGWFKVGGQ